MRKQHYGINKYASIINRLGMMYFDDCLEGTGIGSGQMFFLLRVHEEVEGISILELSSKMIFDKGTTARAVQKLEEQELLYRKHDEKDRRIQRLYLSEKGRLLIPLIKDAIHTWEHIILKDMSDEEARVALKMLQKMSEHAHGYRLHKRREHHE